jgi:hypothetical protein
MGRVCACACACACACVDVRGCGRERCVGVRGYECGPVAVCGSVNGDSRGSSARRGRRCRTPRPLRAAQHASAPPAEHAGTRTCCRASTSRRCCGRSSRRVRFALTVLVTVRPWSSHASALARDCCSIMISLALAGKNLKVEATGLWDGRGLGAARAWSAPCPWATLTCLPLPVANSLSLRSRARGPGTLGRKARCQRQWTPWAAPGWSLRLGQGRVKSRGAGAARATGSEYQPE